MKHVVLYLYEQQHRIQVKELLKTLCYIVLPVIVVFQADLKVSDVKDLSHTSVSMVAQMCSSLIQLFQQSYYGVSLILVFEMMVVDNTFKRSTICHV